MQLRSFLASTTDLARLERESVRTLVAHTRQPQPGSRRPRRPAQPFDEYVLACAAPYQHSLNFRF